MKVLERNQEIREERISNTTVDVRVITQDSQWEQLESEWSELFDLSPYASPCLRFSWLRLWWRLYGPSYGDKAGGLQICAIRRESRLIGAIPLYRSGPCGPVFGVRHIRFLSTGEAQHEETCPDYLGVLCLPGEEETCPRGTP